MVVTRSRASRTQHATHKPTATSEPLTSREIRNPTTPRLHTTKESSARLQSSQKKPSIRRGRSYSTAKRRDRRATLPNANQNLRLPQSRSHGNSDLVPTTVDLQEVTSMFGGAGTYDASIANSEHPESMLVAPNWAQHVSDTIDWHMSLNLCHFFVNLLLKRLAYQRNLMVQKRHDRLHEAHASLIFGQIEFFYSIQHAISGFLCWGDENSDRPESKPAITALAVCRKLATGVPFDQVVLASALNRLHNPLWAMHLGSSHQSPNFPESKGEVHASEGLVDIRVRRTIYGTYFDRSTENVSDRVCIVCYKQKSRGLNEKCISCQGESRGQETRSFETNASNAHDGEPDQSSTATRLTGQLHGKGRQKTLAQVRGESVSAIRDSGFNVPLLSDLRNEDDTEPSTHRAPKRKRKEVETRGPPTSNSVGAQEIAIPLGAPAKKRKTAKKPRSETKPKVTKGAAASEARKNHANAKTTRQAEPKSNPLSDTTTSMGLTGMEKANVAVTVLANSKDQTDPSAKKRPTSRHRPQAKKDAANLSVEESLLNPSDSKASRVSKTSPAGPSHKGQTSTSQKWRAKKFERYQTRDKTPQLVNDLQEEDTIDFADGIEFGNTFDFPAANTRGQKKGKRKGVGQPKKMTNKAAIQQAWEKKGWNSTNDTAEEEREWQEQLDMIRESYRARNQDIPAHLL